MIMHFAFLGATYTSTINSITVTFTAPSEHEISSVKQFKAYVDGDSKEPSCTVYDPISKQPPYQCPIEGLLPAKDYLINSEYCLYSSGACFSGAVTERMWTLPTGKHSTWLQLNTWRGNLT